MTLYKEMKSCKCILGSVQHVWLIGVFLTSVYIYGTKKRHFLCWFVFSWDLLTKRELQKHQKLLNYNAQFPTFLSMITYQIWLQPSIICLKLGNRGQMSLKHFYHCLSIYMLSDQHAKQLGACWPLHLHGDKTKEGGGSIFMLFYCTLLPLSHPPSPLLLLIFLFASLYWATIRSAGSVLEEAFSVNGLTVSAGWLEAGEE